MWTYGDPGPRLSVGDPFAPSLELVDIREGDGFEGGANDGRFRGLGLRVGCGEVKGADAIAVDIL